MKKIVSILLLCLLSMGSAWASVHVSGTIRYASPYKGTRNSGYAIWTHRQKSAYAGMASMPQASMSSANVGMMSTGRSSNNQSRSINYSATGAGAFGIITCATGIRGGVTTKQTAAMMSTSGPNRAGVRRAKKDNLDPSGNPDWLPDCGCYWYEEGGIWHCVNCSYTIDPNDIFDGDYPDHCDCDPCRCPITDGWQVWLFMGTLAAAYALYKRRASHRTVMSVMVARCSRD